MRLRVQAKLLLFIVALGYTNSWLSVPVSAQADRTDRTDARKNECLVAYGEAQEQRMRGSLVDARTQLLICDSATCPEPIMRDCSEWRREVESDLSSVVFAVSDAAGRDVASASVSVNGKPLADLAEGRAQLLDPGSYEYSVDAPGYVRVEGTLVMRQSEKNRIVRVQLEKPGAPLVQLADVSPETSDSHFHVPTASVVLGVTAAVGVASFAYFGLRGRGKRADLDSCTMSCADLIDSGKRDYIVADISLGVGIAAAATAVVIALVEGRSQPRAAEAGSRLALGPTSVEWTLRY